MSASLSACWSFWRGVTGRDTRMTLAGVPFMRKSSMVVESAPLLAYGWLGTGGVALSASMIGSNRVLMLFVGLASGEGPGAAYRHFFSRVAFFCDSEDDSKIVAIVGFWLGSCGGCFRIRLDWGGLIGCRWFLRV